MTAWMKERQNVVTSAHRAWTTIHISTWREKATAKQSMFALYILCNSMALCQTETELKETPNLAPNHQDLQFSL